MKKLITSAGALAVLAALLSGCETPATPAYSSKFGESVRQAQAMQTLNPDAGKNTDPVTGIDGESGKAAIDQYQQSFKAPPKAFEATGIGGDLRGD